MKDYTAGLTGEPFLYKETRIIAQFILDGEDKCALKKRNLDENLIMHKSVGSVKRSNTPIFRRLEVLNNDMIKLLISSDIDSSKYILLYSIMKTDRLVLDFVVEVYRDKLLMRKEFIDKSDINNWYSEKCILSPNLSVKSEQTSNKLKQVIMKIMQDSGLVIKEQNQYKIIRPLLRESFISLLEKEGDLDYAKAIGGLL